MVKLVQIPLQIFVLLHFVDAFTYQSIVRDISICGSTNGHRKYLELFDSGEIFAANISVPKKVIKLIFFSVRSCTCARNNNIDLLDFNWI